MQINQTKVNYIKNSFQKLKELMKSDTIKDYKFRIIIDNEQQIEYLLKDHIDIKPLDDGYVEYDEPLYVTMSFDYFIKYFNSITPKQVQDLDFTVYKSKEIDVYNFPISNWDIDEYYKLFNKDIELSLQPLIEHLGTASFGIIFNKFYNMAILGYQTPNHKLDEDDSFYSDL